MVTAQEKVRLDQGSSLEANRLTRVGQAAPTKSASQPVRTLSRSDEEEDKRSFFQRYRFALVGIAIAGVMVSLMIRMIAGSATAPLRHASLVLVSLPPPPPPPPIPPPPPETVRDEQTFQPEEKPEEEPPKPPDQPPIGTNIKGDGSSNAFNLGNSKGTGFGDQGRRHPRAARHGGSRSAVVSRKRGCSMPELPQDSRTRRRSRP